LQLRARPNRSPPRNSDPTQARLFSQGPRRGGVISPRLTREFFEPPCLPVSFSSPHAFQGFVQRAGGARSVSLRQPVVGQRRADHLHPPRVPAQAIGFGCWSTPSRAGQVGAFAGTGQTSLWSPAYFAASAGGVPSAIIKQRASSSPERPRLSRPESVVTYDSIISSARRAPGGKDPALLWALALPGLSHPGGGAVHPPSCSLPLKSSVGFMPRCRSLGTASLGFARAKAAI
jgi:hypothetical protein